MGNTTSSSSPPPTVLKICCWNILAPELMFYFWRSSYGLKVNDSKDYYNNITKKRIDNIVEYLKKGGFNVICLQEITDKIYPYLDNKTIQQYIADKMGFNLVSQAFKESVFEANLPPTEQQKDGDLKIDSGVSVIASKLITIKPVANSSEFGSSKQFKSGVGSPFTIDQIKMSEGFVDKQGDNKSDVFYYLVNIHVRMNYPHILDSLNESFSRIKSKLTSQQLVWTIFLGDFNAHDSVASKELTNSDLHTHMFDIFGDMPVDDHIFIGRSIRHRYHHAYLDADIDLLEMGLNTPSTGQKWIKADDDYKKSIPNQKLLDSGKATTDHYPIIATLTSKKISKNESQSDQVKSDQVKSDQVKSCLLYTSRCV